MGARWEVALDAQLDMFKSLTSGPGREDVERFARHAVSESPFLDGPGSMWRNLPDRLAAMTYNADPIWVEPEMMTVFEHAVPGFKNEPLQPTDLVTPTGFLLLPRPIRQLDLHDVEVSYRAILWHPQELIVPVPTEEAVKAGIKTGVDAQGNAFLGEMKVPVEKKGHDFTAQGLFVALWHDPDDTDGYSQEEDRRRSPRPFVLSHVLPWSYGAQWGHNEDPRSIIRPVQCLWRLMMQTIAAKTPERASGPFRKRWERANWPEKKIVVVKLRRPYADRDKDAEPKEVNWTHQWIVGGHWRNQWYASVQLHRQIWVSPYVKGPPELPLVVNKTRVFEFVQ